MVQTVQAAGELVLAVLVEVQLLLEVAQALDLAALLDLCWLESHHPFCHLEVPRKEY